MILTELVLHNVGTFAGRHAINLTPPSSSRPVILIGGLNGAGKTTILEAIHLALYGPLATNSGRRAGTSYESYLRGLIHRGVPISEGAAVELTFKAHQEGEEHTYRVRRSWKATGASVKEMLIAFVDDKYNPTLASTWNEHIETFLPRGIAGLFFFDGEQIEALADLERSRQVLGSALAALLGLDLVDRLSNDLTVLKRRHRSDELPETLRLSLDEKKQTVVAYRQAEESATSAAAARLTELERCQKLFHDATEAYRAAGGDLFEQRDASEAVIAAARLGLEHAEDDIRQELGEVAPLLQIPELIEQLVVQVREERRASRDAILLDALQERDEALVNKMQGARVSKLSVAVLEDFLREDRAERSASAANLKLIGLLDTEALDRAIASLPAARKRLQASLDRRESFKADVDQAERALSAIPDPESLAPLTRAREEARDDLLRAEAAHTMAVESLASASADRGKAMDSYESALDKATIANLTAEDDRRLVEHVDRVRETLGALRLAATRQHLDRISQLVLQALASLLRKERLITDIKIDPETCTVSLTGTAGHDLPAKDLSAGERQLLAVALLWGLARAAGQPLPVVIDTPLGRLDGGHREHLLQRYFPQASHQVILLSTDTEIDEEAYRLIAARVGRSYRLEFDSKNHATVVQDGYFWS